MAKIYEFPQGADRQRLKEEIDSQRKRQPNEKSGYQFLNYIKRGWFYARLMIAATMHFISVITLAILAAFSKAIFWVGGIICLVTWFHLDREIWSPHNLTIPVIAGLWALSLFAAPLIKFLNQRTPWHSLLVPRAKYPRTEVTRDELL